MNRERLSEITGKFYRRAKTLGENLHQKYPGAYRLLGKGLDSGQKFFDKHGYLLIGKIATVVLWAYYLSDVTSVMIQSLMSSDSAKKAASRTAPPQSRARVNFDKIYQRNLFNSKGLIPGEGRPEKKNNPDAPAVRTGLPLALIGTVILQDDPRSLATVQDKAGNKVYPVRLGDEIPQKLKVTKVEARKLTFINLKNRRNEYIDMPEDQQIKPRVVSRGTPAPSEGINKLSGSRFRVSRDKIDSTLGNLDKVLTEARVIPHFENGAAAGFKIVNIKSGSVYEELGLQNNDILVQVNGEEIDASKAFQFLNELKESKSIELTVKRDGVESTTTYDIE